MAIVCAIALLQFGFDGFNHVLFIICKMFSLGVCTVYWCGHKALQQEPRTSQFRKKRVYGLLASNFLRMLLDLLARQNINERVGWCF